MTNSVADGLNQCVTTKDLESFLLGTTSDDDHRGLVAHLDRCSSCAAQLEKLAASSHGVDMEIEVESADEGATDWNQLSVERLAALVRNGVSLVERSSRDATEPHLEPDVDGYQIKELIGRGGMGTVYRATQHDLNRDVAVKILSANSSVTRDELAARFSREAQVTARLDHPSIVPVYSTGFDKHDRCYYTMRLVRGREVKEIIRLADAESEGWNRSRALSVLVRICQAMAFAHSKGVVHRDLKPGNVMVGSLGEVYVLDWGLARVSGTKEVRDIRIRTMDAHQNGPADGDVAQVDEQCDTVTIAAASASTFGEPLMTVDGAVIGTPSYMPPEQARGDIDNIDHLSDIYSLGGILYELLTLRSPYTTPGEPKSSRELLTAVIDGPPDPVADLSPAAPPELHAICEKAMARDRQRRYSTALDMAEDLQAFLDNRVVSAYRTGAVVEARKWVTRNRTAAVLSLLAVMLVVVGVSVVGLVQFRANRDLSAANIAKQGALDEQLRIGGELKQANSNLGATNNELKRVNDELGATNNKLGKVNDELAEANSAITDAFLRESQAKKREARAALSEKEAKQAALSKLAESYANFGELEVERGNLAKGSMWFAKAAELCDHTPDIQQVHRMRAMQFRRAFPQAIAAYWDRARLKLVGWHEWPMVEQFVMNSTGQYLLRRGRIHANHLPPRDYWTYTRIIDVWNNDRPWSNTAFDSAAFAPDGKHVAVSKGGEVSIRRLSDEQVVRTLPGKADSPIRILNYSHGGKLLFVGPSTSGRTRSRIWNVNESRYQDGTYGDGKLLDVGFGKDDRQLLTMVDKDKYELFDIADKPGPREPTGLPGTEKRDEDTEETASTERLDQLMSRFTMNYRRKLPTHSPDGEHVTPALMWHRQVADDVHGRDFDETGSLMAQAHGNGTIRLFRHAAKPYWFIRTPAWARPVFSPDSKLVVAVGHFAHSDAGVGLIQNKQELVKTRVHDTATGEAVGAEIEAGRAIINGLFSQDSQTLVLLCGAVERNKLTPFLPGGLGGEVQFRDWKSGKLTGASVPMPSEPMVAVWHPKSEQLVVACAGGQVMTIDPASREAKQVYFEPARDIEVSPWPYTTTGGLLVDPTGEKMVWWGFTQPRIINLKTGKVLHTVTDYKTIDPTWMALSGSRLVAQHGVNNAAVWSVTSGRRGYGIGKARSLAVSQDGQFVAGIDRHYQTIFDVFQRKEIQPQFGTGGNDIEFIPHTPYLISTRTSSWTPAPPTTSTIEFWDRHTGRIAAPKIELPNSPFTSFLTVTNDGHFAAMTCRPYGLLVLDLRSFHEDPLEGLTPEDAMLHAQLQSRFEFDGGRLVKTGGEKWTDRWDDFTTRNPGFFRRDRPRTLAVRHHRTRANESEVRGLNDAAEFHRGLLAKIAAGPEPEPMPAVTRPEPPRDADSPEDDSKPIQLAGTAAAWQPTSDQQTFAESVSRLEPRAQAEAVAAKLREVNPGFKATVQHEVVGDKVIILTVKDGWFPELWPVAALSELRMLDAVITPETDLAPLSVLPLLHLAGVSISPLNDHTGNLLYTLPNLKTINEVPVQAWLKRRLETDAIRRAKVSPQVRLKRVLDQLENWNAGFDAESVTVRIDEGRVIQLEFSKGSGVTDLTPVAALSGLEKLICRSNDISDLTPLQGLPLKSVDVTRNKRLASLIGLEGPTLETLFCYGTRVDDLSPLKGAPLTTLSCYAARISDLSPLKGMPLTYLYCDSKGLTDLSPLSDSTISHLTIPNSGVTDLKPLAGRPLTSLNLDNTSVSDLTPLRGMPLQKLWITRTAVKDLAPVEGLPLVEFFCPDLKTLQNAHVLLKCRKLQKINGKPAAKQLAIVRQPD